MTTERRDPAHDRLEALLYYCRAIYLAKTAAYEEAATTALEGHTRYRRLSTPLMAAACLAEAGEAKLRISQNKTARHYFQEARALYESVHDATGESRCLSGLAWAALNLSDVEGALADLDTALSLNQHHQDTLGQAQVLFTLAAAWTYYYHPSRIRRYAHEALRLFRAMGYQAMTLRAAVYEALAMRMDGNLVEAAQQFMHIHRKAQRAQDSWLAGWTAQSLGRLALQSGRAAEAEQWLESARQSRRRSGELQNQVSDLAWLGRLRLSQGRVDAAVACTTAAVEQLEASLDEYYVFETPDVFLCHAESLTAAGRKDDATPFIRRAHDELQTFARKIRDPKVKAQYLDYWVSRRILESWQLGEARPLYPGRPT